MKLYILYYRQKNIYKTNENKCIDDPSCSSWLLLTTFYILFSFVFFYFIAIVDFLLVDHSDYIRICRMDVSVRTTTTTTIDRNHNS